MTDLEAIGEQIGRRIAAIVVLSGSFDPDKGPDVVQSFLSAFGRGFAAELRRPSIAYLERIVDRRIARFAAAFAEELEDMNSEAAA